MGYNDSRMGKTNDPVNTCEEKVMLKAKENAVLIALFIVFMCTLLFHKVNYNIDELLSYGLANHISGGIEFDDGVAYTPAQQPWLSYLTAGGGDSICIMYGRIRHRTYILRSIICCYM